MFHLYSVSLDGLCWTEDNLSTTIEPTSLDYALPDNQSEQGFLGISPETWARVGIITGLFVAVFWPNLRRLWLKINFFTGEDNWKHGLTVPLIGLYYLFVHREDLIKAQSKQFIWGPILRPGRAVIGGIMFVVGGGLFLALRHQPGLIFSLVKPASFAVGVLGALVLLLDWSLASIMFGLAVYVYGTAPGYNDYLKDMGMIITLFGVVLLLTGPRVMKIAWFPIVFLICAIPWPGLVYSWVAEPLQQMAATVAVDVLKISGVDAVCSGTKIIIFNSALLPPRVLNVAEACAGMRSLMTFISVGGAIAFLSPRPMWQKLFIICSTVPIAIFCNVMRISGQGLLDHYVSPKWSESFAHQFVGMMMLLPAFFMILGVGYVLDKLFIEEAEEGDANFKLMPKSVVGIATREEAIPALGTISGIGAPGIKPVTPVARQVGSPRPATITPAIAPVTAVKPVAPVAAVKPIAPVVAPIAVQPVAPKPLATKVVATRPPGAMPPRPITPANPVRPAVPVNAVPPKPATNGQPIRTAPTAVRPPVRPVGAPTDARRVPPSQPNALRPKESK